MIVDSNYQAFRIRVHYASLRCTDTTPIQPEPSGRNDLDRSRHQAMVFWGNSLDNVTPQEHIRYHLHLNGQFDGATIDPYPHQFSMYLTLGVVNTIEVYAVDEAGNRSAPATMTIDLRTP